MNATAITNSAVPTIHNRKSPRRQFIVQPILDPASHDLAGSTHYDKDKATPTPPIIAMLPLEEEQDTNTNQEQANGVECCYFVAGDKPDQLLHDDPPLIGPFSHVPALSFPDDTSRPKAQLSRRMNEPDTMGFDGGYAGLAWVLFVYRRYRKI